MYVYISMLYTIPCCVLWFQKEAAPLVGDHIYPTSNLVHISVQGTDSVVAGNVSDIAGLCGVGKPTWRISMG